MNINSEQKSQSHRFSEVYFHLFPGGDKLKVYFEGRNPIALVRSISTVYLYPQRQGFDCLPSQSHRFSEVYFHNFFRKEGNDETNEKSQSYRFSEVYFHADIRNGKKPAPQKSQSHRFSEVYFHNDMAQEKLTAAE